MSAALFARSGRKILLTGLAETLRAALMSAVSPLRLQPRVLAQSRSWSLQAQSRASMQGSLKSPPASL